MIRRQPAARPYRRPKRWAPRPDCPHWPKRQVRPHRYHVRRRCQSHLSRCWMRAGSGSRSVRPRPGGPFRATSGHHAPRRGKRPPVRRPDRVARPGAGPVALGRVTPGHMSAAPDPSVPPSTEPDLATVPPARAPGPARVDRQEFIRAFAEQSWARPGTDRPVARVHVTLMVTMGALVIAVVTGALLQMVHPVKLAAAAAPLASGSPRYTAVTGW